ncbi:MAG TPA: YjbH domain-containing protein [Paraburkholderia sp.]
MSSKKRTTARDRRGRAWLIRVLVCATPGVAHAAFTGAVGTPAYLGDWLVTQGVAARLFAPDAGSGDLYASGLAWQSSIERVSQEQQRQRLMADIDALRAHSPERVAMRNRLADFVAARPATGRVFVKSADARWLQTNPPSDPMLQSGDTIVVPDRPTTVTVVRTDGTLCVLPSAPNVEALQYVLACDPDAKPDLAWIVQPDGTVSENRVAAWNRSRQDLPAPGSWIWAPDRGSLWTHDVSAAFARFLGTQGVSGFDSDGRPLAVSGAAPRVQTTFLFNTPTRSDDFPVTASDWGDAGILQTPTAQMNEAGEGTLSITHVTPYTRLNFMLQPLDWLEFGFRYTDISDALYGPVALSGTQSYKDKSVDVKVRLLKESAFIPAVAVGIRDVGGTGLFSGEYLVASKRTGSFDWSLGLGWGYVGARGDLPNPLSVLSSRFDTRSDSVGSGGTPGVGAWFRGRTSPFGGVQYQTPWERWILKLEYDGNNYQHEPFGTVLPDRSPFNFGVVYRATRNVDFTVAYERGTQVMLGIALHGNVKNASMPKIGDPQPLPMIVPSPSDAAAPAAAPSTAPVANTPAPTPPMAAAPVASAPPTPSAPAPASVPAAQPVVVSPPDTDWSAAVAMLQEQTGWHVRSIHRLGPELVVEFDDIDAFYLKDHLDRVAAVLNRFAPPDVVSFRIVPVRYGIPVTDFQVRRAQWVASHSRALLPEEQAPSIVSAEPLTQQSIDMLPPVFEQAPKRFNFSIGPGYQQTLGGPNGFVLFQLSANAKVEWRITPDLWLSGDLNIGIVNNYDKFTYTAPSSLPRVRTYLAQYLTSSRVTIPFLQLTKFGRLSDDQFYSLYGGLLESMFAGVGGEWLYRPADSRLAIGVDMNGVRQRGFRQNFAMRDYSAFTGHVTAYWDTGWNNVQVNLSVGQYLAKDKGATLDISRRFRNGMVMGAYATKTNVSSAEFGEGSFDKGIYLTIPFDAMMTRSSGGMANMIWDPLTRDGGAQLARQYPLYNVTNMDDPRSLWYGPPGAGATP